MRGDSAVDDRRRADLVGTAYLVTTDPALAVSCVDQALSGGRLRGSPPSDAEVLRRVVETATLRPGTAAVPGDDVDAVLVGALRRFPPRVRAVLALHLVRVLSPDVVGAMLGEQPGTVVAQRVHAVPRLAEAIDAGPEEVHARLSRLATSVAGAAPAPVAPATRANRTWLLIGAAVVVLLAVWTASTTVWILRHKPAVVPAGEGGPDGAMGNVSETTGAEGVPGPPFTVVYQDVTVRIPTPESRCGHSYGVSLQEPERVGSYPYGDKSRGDLTYAADCEGTAWFSISARGESTDDKAVTPEHCAELIATERSDAFMTMDAQVHCLIAEADPARGRPMLLVRLVTVSDELHENMYWKATAWKGTASASGFGDPGAGDPTPGTGLAQPGDGYGATGSGAGQSDGAGGPGSTWQGGEPGTGWQGGDVPLGGAAGGASGAGGGAASGQIEEESGAAGGNWPDPSPTRTSR